MDDQTLHHFMQDLISLAVIVSMIVSGAWILVKIIGAFRDRSRTKILSELQNKMLDKFSSGSEFAAFLQTEAGSRFIMDLDSEPARPLTGILGSIRFGVILTLTGMGFLILSKTARTQDAGDVLFILTVVSLTVGLGFLISSAISYRLAKKWDMITLRQKAGAEGVKLQ